MNTRAEQMEFYREKGTNPETLPAIKFTFEDKEYTTDYIDAYDLNKDIKLPDGRIVRPISWFERFPPFPSGFTEVKSEYITKAYDTK